MRFSQRIGRTPVRTALQVESMDEDLKNSLWNILQEKFFSSFSSYSRYGGDSQLDVICSEIWKSFFKRRIDEYQSYDSLFDLLNQWYFHESDWAQKYDLIEYIALSYDNIDIDFTESCNAVLRLEQSAYRIVKGEIVQITSEEEIVAIEEAIDNSNAYKSVNEHLRTALEFLSDRKNPDYRNSIKESISAVESFCKIVTEDSKATLGPALAVIEKKFELHGSLKSAFKSLYGYTSDAGGIRHAMLEDQAEIRFEDAKFMLVTCSAFINYLKVKVST